MAKLLFSWIGTTDLKAAENSNEVGMGPVAQAVEHRTFDRVILLNNFPQESAAAYLSWLNARTKTSLELRQVSLSGPTEFAEIYAEASRVVADELTGHPQAQATFHLSPGTPAMAAVWILLAKTRFDASLIESSRQHGVRDVVFPFDLAAEFLPEVIRRTDERMRQVAAAESPVAAEFGSIIHRSAVMRRLLQRGQKVAAFDVPVLIEGESGTGKELLARALHAAGSRAPRQFVAVNCGAIPETLVDSTLFGHEKGAFTGADRARTGLFEEAHQGTLFLDEIGELPKPTQVRLLRALQEGEVQRVGSSAVRKVDVRVIAATNRNLLAEVEAGSFRADLFYRLAVAILRLPPLRDRQGDLGLLIDHHLDQLHRVQRLPRKRLSAKARSLLLQHPWPGNVRELFNTLTRVVLWSVADTVDVDEAEEAILAQGSGTVDLLAQPIGEGFEISVLLDDVARHYLRRALDQAHGNKTEAAALLGLASYQTLTNWTKRLGIQT